MNEKEIQIVMDALAGHPVTTTSEFANRVEQILRFQAGILGYSIAGMKAFEGKFSYKNQLFS